MEEQLDALAEEMFYFVGEIVTVELEVNLVKTRYVFKLVYIQI